MTELVRAAGLEPAQAFRPYGFSCPLRLSPPDPARSSAPEGLGSGLSLHLGRVALGAARLVSTPSRFRAWLGVVARVSLHAGSSPNLTGFTLRLSHPGAQIFKSLVSTNFTIGALRITSKPVLAGNEVSNCMC